jgi:hypothetical protein
MRGFTSSGAALFCAIDLQPNRDSPHRQHSKKFQGSFHPETQDKHFAVSRSERGDFLSWQGNQGIARRRTQVRRTSNLAD